MTNRVAVFIVNYNMPERTDALCRYIDQHTRWPHDLIVIDNGSDIAEQSKYTALRLERNVQTTNGWLMGLSYADAMATYIHREPYLAYWFLITSAAFPISFHGDPLTPMVTHLLRNDDAIAVHPALTEDSTTMWTHLITRGGELPRKTWMVDNIASLYRADWFDAQGRWDARLVYAHGIDLEMCYWARKQGKSLWVDERVRIEKITNIGYAMNRMNMSALQRAANAQANMDYVLIPRYGYDYWQRLTEDYREDAWL